MYVHVHTYIHTYTQEAIDSCPVDCIHDVTFEELEVTMLHIFSQIFAILAHKKTFILPF